MVDKTIINKKHFHIRIDLEQQEKWKWTITK